MSAPKNERIFDPNASIVLVGCRGAGKRTLGFMGALHLRRRLVTEDHYFEKVTGLSRGEYLSLHGKDHFARQNIEVFKRMLDSNRQGCIIECGMSSFAEEAQDLLRILSKTHPVVYIHREREQVSQLLDAADVDQLLKADEKHRSCSNLEYYNLYDESSCGAAGLSSSGTSSPTDGSRQTSSKLLRAREDFTKFLDLITGRGAKRAWIESPFSVKAVPPEFRSFSYALRLRLSYLVDMDLEWEDLEARADCIELIIDTWPDDLMNLVSRQVALIRRKLGVPIIYHVEENPRGERRRLPEEKDMMDSELLELGIRLGVEYISLDLQRNEALVKRVLSHRGRSKIIGNFWHLNMGAVPWLDDKQLEYYARARDLGCDIVRIVRFCAADSSPEILEQFKKKLDEAFPDPKPPLVAYDFSVLGARTPLQAKVLAPVKHPDIVNERDHLATVSTAAHAIEGLFRQFLLEPLQFYVLGSNVSYSLNPAMQKAAYEFSGMPHTFRAVTCSTLDSLNQICLSDSFGGACLTTPFKVAIMPHLNVKSHHATAIGAVNVMLPLRGQTGTILDHANSRNRGGSAQSFFGDNTDWSSIVTCLRRAISPRNTVQPSKTTGLVIGAGGMARAAIYALIQLGCRNIFIYNRTAANAAQVANHFNEWAAKQGIITNGAANNSSNNNNSNSTTPPPPPFATPTAVSQICHVLPSLSDPWPTGYQLPTMVISCVPATSVDGNAPADFEMPLDWLRSPTGGVVVELAYEPLITPLVAQMQALHQNSSRRTTNANANGGGNNNSNNSNSNVLPSPSWAVVDGLEVVAEMAIEAFELMTGRPAPKRLMKDVGRKTWEQQQQRGYIPTSYYDIVQ